MHMEYTGIREDEYLIVDEEAVPGWGCLLCLGSGAKGVPTVSFYSRAPESEVNFAREVVSCRK